MRPGGPPGTDERASSRRPYGHDVREACATGSPESWHLSRYFPPSPLPAQGYFRFSLDARPPRVATSGATTCLACDRFDLLPTRGPATALATHRSSASGAICCAGGTQRSSQCLQTVFVGAHGAPSRWC